MSRRPRSSSRFKKLRIQARSAARPNGLTCHRGNPTATTAPNGAYWCETFTAWEGCGLGPLIGAKANTPTKAASTKVGARQTASMDRKPRCPARNSREPHHPNATPPPASSTTRTGGKAKIRATVATVVTTPMMRRISIGTRIRATQSRIKCQIQTDPQPTQGSPTSACAGGSLSLGSQAAHDAAVLMPQQ
jgi:hypothetical protein